MRNKLSKILKDVLLSLLNFVNFIYAKAVHATVIYAPPEVFERREARTNILSDFITDFIIEHTVLFIFVSLLVIIGLIFGLISIVKVILLKIFRKKKQDQNIQPQKSTDELPKQ